MKDNSDRESIDELFIERHNGFLKDGKPDDEYWEAKEGRYQYRIHSGHYVSEEYARERLQEIINSIKIAKFGKAIRYVIDSRIRLETRLGKNEVLVKELLELQKLLPEYKTKD